MALVNEIVDNNLFLKCFQRKMYQRKISTKNIIFTDRNHFRHALKKTYAGVDFLFHFVHNFKMEFIGTPWIFAPNFHVSFIGEIGQ